jgi:DNA-binding transcriptional MerR regulator
MEMRELEARSGVNRETIRVYFRLGLLPEPQRGKPNVADYSEAHVVAVRRIRRPQEEQGPTLPRIRAALTGSGAEMPRGPGAFVHLERPVSGRLAHDDALAASEGAAFLDIVIGRLDEARAAALATRGVADYAPPARYSGSGGMPSALR